MGAANLIPMGAGTLRPSASPLYITCPSPRFREMRQFVWGAVQSWEAAGLESEPISELPRRPGSLGTSVYEWAKHTTLQGVF